MFSSVKDATNSGSFSTAPVFSSVIAVTIEILVLRSVGLREHEQAVGVVRVVPEIELVREHALGLGAVVRRQARLRIERVGDHVAARAGGGAADHEHALDAVGGRVVVRAQLAVAHGCLAVVRR